MNSRLTVLAAIALLAVLGVRGDELKLKDGSKIDGTIVGFERDSFRVKTSYGFAVVRKDQVASISIADSAKEPAAKKSASAESKGEPSEKSTKAQVSAASPSGAASPLTNSRATSSPTSASRNVASVAPAKSAAAASTEAEAPAEVSVSLPAVAAAPPVPTASPSIREQVNGNTYTNETYGFSMYKPPDWELVAGARGLLPGAITALGTDDQTTYLLIGEDAAGKSIESQLNATVSRLSEIMDNFNPLAETRVNIAGSQAVERRFHGSVDQHDWSGVVVLVPRGARVFTIFGMTYAETDLVQIQENVISRAISSIQFTKP
jgi:hypothetical protein